MRFALSKKQPGYRDHEPGLGLRIPKSLQTIFVACNQDLMDDKNLVDITKATKDIDNNGKKSLPRKWFKNVGKPGAVLKDARSLLYRGISGTSTTSLDSDDQSLGSVKSIRSVRSVMSDVNLKVKKKSSKNLSAPQMSPQDYLDALLLIRGYSTEKYEVLKSAYYNKPTDLQKASYGIHILQVTKNYDYQQLEDLLEAGLSPNPANMFGESLVHLVCRLGAFTLLQVMLDYGCSLQVSDDYGRTPLHDLAWAPTPCFESVSMVLEADRRLLYMKDARGNVPLHYVTPENWSQWISYLESKKDVFWPRRFPTMDGEEGPPPLTEQAPDSCPIRDPDNALPLDLASMIAAGTLKPGEANIVRCTFHTCNVGNDEDWSSNSGSSSNSSSSSSSGGSDDDSFYSDFSDDSSTFDDDEVNEIFNTLNALKSKA